MIIKVESLGKKKLYELAVRNKIVSLPGKIEACDYKNQNDKLLPGREILRWYDVFTEYTVYKTLLNNRILILFQTMDNTDGTTSTRVLYREGEAVDFVKNRFNEVF